MLLFPLPVLRGRERTPKRRNPDNEGNPGRTRIGFETSAMPRRKEARVRPGNKNNEIDNYGQMTVVDSSIDELEAS